MCQNYEVLVEDKRAEKTRGAEPSKRYETRSGPRKKDSGSSCSQDRMKSIGYRLSTEIKRATRKKDSGFRYGVKPG